MIITGSQSVAWDAVVGAVSYEIELLNAAAGVVLATFPENLDTDIAASELLFGKGSGNYNVRVRAYDAVGPGDWSGLFSIEYAALPSPQNVRVE